MYCEQSNALLRKTFINMLLGANTHKDGSKETLCLAIGRRLVSTQDPIPRPMQRSSFISTTGDGRGFPSFCALEKECQKKRPLSPSNLGRCLMQPFQKSSSTNSFPIG